jgi:hypothetical protein
MRRRLIKIVELEGKRIDLDMTPEMAFTSLSGIKSMVNLRYPFVDVVSFRAFLAWMAFDAEGSSPWVERVDDKDREASGISYDMLLAAIEEAGGALSRSGHYPINSAIKEKLAISVEIKEKLAEVRNPYH